MEKLILIKTVSELEDLKKYLEDKDVVSFDTETTGLDKSAQIIGFSVAAEEEVGYYVITMYWDKDKGELGQNWDIIDQAPSFMKLLSIKTLIMHNAVFDCDKVMTNYGVDLMPSVFCDTMLLAHVCNENRHCGLKELAAGLFGDDSRKEQAEMKESVHANGGQLVRGNYELYKADADLIGRYGAKDTILTLKLFNELVPSLYDQKLDAFFFDEESMPLLKTVTYELNTIGLKVDMKKLADLKKTLEADCLENKAFIYKEIDSYIKDKYPGTSKKNQFNVEAPRQLAWLLFSRLDNEFGLLNDTGKEVCKALNLKIPYTISARRDFIIACTENKGRVYKDAEYNIKTKRLGKPRKVGDFWEYTKCDKVVLTALAKKYKWVETFIRYKKDIKILSAYVIGLEEKTQYGTVQPSFLQHGTTSGRYSSRNPNFQNLPREDKRVKSCIVSRPGKSFIAADYSQLEPRVFASISQDRTLMDCFKSGEDFYSVVGAPIFGKQGLSLVKDEPGSFAQKYPHLRDMSKVISLATPYGRTAFQQAGAMGISRDEAQDLINQYFTAYPKVELMMLESHEQAKAEGKVYNLFGRPRRIPAAMDIPKGINHSELPYEYRTLLNLAMNHRVQSTGASIMNRAAIAFYNKIKELGIKGCHVVMQVHDELVAECEDKDIPVVKQAMKDAMENTVKLPGVELIAEPKSGKSLADVK